MRSGTLEVPVAVIIAFAKKAGELDVRNEITGVNIYNQILVEVYYEKSELDKVDALETYLANLIEGLEDEDNGDN